MAAPSGEPSLNALSKAVGATPHRIGEEVVAVASQGHRQCRWQLPGSGSGDGQYLEVHACGVHPGQSLFADIEQQLIGFVFITERGEPLNVFKFQSLLFR
jgi:hypothetical protein